MRVFLLGTTKFSLRCLEALERCGQDVVGCATTPAVFSISYAPTGVQNVNYVDFEEVGKSRNIPAIGYDREDPLTFQQSVPALRPDILLAAGWYYMVGSKLRAVAPLGAVGLHASELPRYRGGAPLVWQIIRGEPSAGISLFYLEDGVDTGDVIGALNFPIEKHDTIAKAMESMEAGAEALIEKYFPLLEKGMAPRLPQDESLASEFPQRSPEDGEIDWTCSATEIYNFIRAQTRPYPGAFTRVGGKKVTIWDAKIVEEDNSP